MLPGSHLTKDLYPGCLSTLEGSRPIAGGVISLKVLEEDLPRRVFLSLNPGDMTVHEEWIVHGSEGNTSQTTRDTLIMAYRAVSMIQVEREAGFRHSYNDDESVLEKVRTHLWE